MQKNGFSDLHTNFTLFKLEYVMRGINERDIEIYGYHAFR